MEEVLSLSPTISLGKFMNLIFGKSHLDNPIRVVEGMERVLLILLQTEEVGRALSVQGFADHLPRQHSLFLSLILKDWMGGEDTMKMLLNMILWEELDSR